MVNCVELSTVRIVVWLLHSVAPPIISMKTGFDAVSIVVSATVIWQLPPFDPTPVTDIPDDAMFDVMVSGPTDVTDWDSV